MIDSTWNVGQDTSPVRVRVRVRVESRSEQNAIPNANVDTSAQLAINYYSLSSLDLATKKGREREKRERVKKNQTHATMPNPDGGRVELAASIIRHDGLGFRGGNI